MAIEASESEDDLLWNAPVALVEVDLGGVIRSHNGVLPLWLNETETRESGVLNGRNLVDWLPLAARLHYETSLIPELLQAGRLREKIIEIRTASGKLQSVLLNANLKKYPDTGQYRIYISLMEASERIRFEQGLISAQRTAQIAQERLHLLQDATSQLAVASGLDDLGRVLSESAARATQTAWSCVTVSSQTRTVSDSRVLEHAQVWGDIPDFGFPISELVSEAVTMVYRSPAEIHAAFPSHSAEILASGVEALIVSPILRSSQNGQPGEVLGAIVNLFRRGRTLEADVVETLQALTVQAERVLEHLRLQEQTRYRAMHDALTGLANRAMLLDRLEHTIAVAQRAQAPCAVLFLDLDGFKAINDQLGHGVGDAVLKEVAERLRHTCRQTEILCRLGGDEFVVAGEQLTFETAGEIADRILHAVRQPLDGIAPGFPLSASIGVLVWEPGDAAVPTASELLDSADAVMYIAKRGGKNNVVKQRWAPQQALPNE